MDSNTSYGINTDIEIDISNSNNLTLFSHILITTTYNRIIKLASKS